MAERKKVERDNWGDFSPEAIRERWEEMCKTASDRICYHCVYLLQPRRLEGIGYTPVWKVRYPVCINHADSVGVPREVHPAETCPNFRAKPKPPVRVEPPKPERPTDRYIPLTRGLWAVVDAADFERLNTYRWYASPSGGGKMYARQNTRTGTILMHREISKPPKGMHVDHKDGNGLNNRSDNLRNCTPAQNEYNKPPRGKRSRFKGVYPDGNKWYAVIKHKGRTYYLGTFDSEIEAARARDRKARELEGEFAYLNLPDEIVGKG
ncbi:MAG: HNH endonuclease [Sedimentisphaerales bacterium]|nr:HNH endonuclease [Sedimentisphaerales bacterium]